MNIGLGRAKDDKKMFEVATEHTSQDYRSATSRNIAKNSIASFKLREGNKIGLKVTLRGERMYEFIDRLITVVLPRLRDFHGVSNKAFDRQGNYSLGMIDQSVFPELTFEETTTVHGLQVVFVIKSKDQRTRKALLEIWYAFRKGE